MEMSWSCVRRAGKEEKTGEMGGIEEEKGDFFGGKWSGNKGREVK